MDEIAARIMALDIGIRLKVGLEVAYQYSLFSSTAGSNSSPSLKTLTSALPFFILFILLLSTLWPRYHATDLHSALWSRFRKKPRMMAGCTFLPMNPTPTTMCEPLPLEALTALYFLFLVQ